MEQIALMDRYPVFTKKIAKNETSFKTVDDIVAYLREKIEAHPIGIYIGIVDHYAYTSGLEVHEIADDIKLKYPEALLFRIHGSSFALLFEQYVNVDIDYFLSKNIFADNDLYITSHNIDLTKYDSLDDVEMEKIFSDKYI